MKSIILLFLPYLLISCNSDKGAKLCQELAKVTGEKQYASMDDCSGEWENLKNEVKEGENKKKRNLDRANKFKGEKAAPQDLAHVEVANRMKMLEPIRSKICDQIEQNNKNDLLKAEGYLISITHYQEVGLVYGINGHYPNAADMESKFFTASGEIFCTAGGFSGGNCSEITKKHEIVESYFFRGSVAETSAFASCKD